jgi:multiple antibiotic resistance protein
MSDLASHAITVFMAFFALVNPVPLTAMFIGITGEYDTASRRRVAMKAVLTAFLIVLVFCALGKLVFELFGITLPAMRIAGGILIFVVGYQMLHGDTAKMHHPAGGGKIEPADPDMSIAITPLAIPVIAGPGTIATAMNFAATGSVIEIIITISAFAVMSVILLLCFLSGQRILKLLGDGGITVVIRLMGFIVAVIGTQMVIQGVHDAAQLF